MAAAAQDSAVIVNSGSTNTGGYKITLTADGKGSAVVQSRTGIVSGAPKSFTVSAETASRFFADLAAARAAKLTTSPCMKSASFGTSTHVIWQGWTSPDLDCPPGGSAAEALIKDVEEIHQASHIGVPLRQP